MSQKTCIFLCLIALLVISGCIDKPQTQAEKVGWNQAEYEEYSKLYDSIYEYDYDSSPAYTSSDIEQHRVAAQTKFLKLDEVQTKINQKEVTEFGQAWDFAFLSYRIGLIGINMSYDMQMPLRDGTLRDTPEAKEYRDKTKNMFNYSLEYRQKIEDMKVKLSR